MTEQATSTSREEAPTGDDSARPGDATPETPFTDLDDYLALRRLGGLALSPDGIRLVTTVAERTPDGKRFSTSLWEVDPGGQRPPRRLTRSAPGEAHPAFLRTAGCCSPRAARMRRPSRTRTPRTALRCGCFRRQARRARWRGAAATVGDVAVARDSGHVAFTGVDAAGRGYGRGRRETATGAQGRRSDGDPAREPPGPVLGPRPRAGRVARPVLRARPGRRRAADRRARPDPGRGAAMSARASPSLPTAGRSRSSGGSTKGAAAHHGSLAIIDTASGERRILSTDGLWLSDPAFSPDGRSLAYLQETLGDWDTAPRRTLQLLDLATDEAREVLPADTTAWPSHPVFSPDGAFLYFLADEGGRAPVFRLDLSSGAVVRLTASGAYTDLVVSPDGSALFALRSAVDSPPTPVRLDPTREDQEAVALLGPQADVPIPGRLTEVRTDRRGRHAAARLAGAAVGRRRRRAGAAAAVDPRWSGQQLERVVVAVEPVADGGPRVRRSAAGSGAVDRLRSRVPPARLGSAGAVVRSPTS